MVYTWLRSRGTLPKTSALRFPLRLWSSVSSSLLYQLTMRHTSCCTVADIKPLRLVILLASVVALAASVPKEPVAVGLMTPLYRMAPGLYGW
jgi:hypothetical protein